MKKLTANPFKFGDPVAGDYFLNEEGTGKGAVLFDDPLFAFWLRMSFDP